MTGSSQMPRRDRFKTEFVELLHSSWDVFFSRQFVYNELLEAEEMLRSKFRIITSYYHHDNMVVMNARLGYF
jgi:hypothetical protein